jgi:hypothetical protein
MAAVSNASRGLPCKPSAWVSSRTDDPCGRWTRPASRSRMARGLRPARSANASCDSNAASRYRRSNTRNGAAGIEPTTPGRTATDSSSGSRLAIPTPPSSHPDLRDDPRWLGKKGRSAVADPVMGLGSAEWILPPRRDHQSAMAPPLKLATVAVIALALSETRKAATSATSTGSPPTPA